MRCPFKLLLITDDADGLVRRVEAALSAAEARGVGVLLRDKRASSRALLDTALRLRELTRRYAATLLISDRSDVALLSEADGVHLPEQGLTVREARTLLGPGRLIGVSRHDAAGILAAHEQGADYATLSPVFTSPNKGAPLGMAGFAQIVAELEARPSSPRLAVLALGGITASEVPGLIQAGAAGVAVIREVMSASAPGAAVVQLLRALELFDSP